jgi:hypothetical protein
MGYGDGITLGLTILGERWVQLGNKRADEANYGQTLQGKIHGKSSSSIIIISSSIILSIIIIIITKSPRSLPDIIASFRFHKLLATLRSSSLLACFVLA